jgi:cytochrome P450
MHYLELCIKETMRMFPVAPLIGRRLTGDVELSKYPSGRAVLANPAIQHAVNKRRATADHVSGKERD